MEIRVGMPDLREKCRPLDLHAQLFPQFPAQRLLERFLLLSLAAGEFPEAGEKSFRWPLLDQNLITLSDDADDRFDLPRFFSSGLPRDEFLLSSLISQTESPDGALQAERIPGQADQRTKVHQGQMESARVS